jgi:superfamily II DNA or RNA helicase
LTTQKGFAIHLTSLQAHVAYEVTAEGRLTFHRQMTIPEDPKLVKDFGNWIYIAGQGFYTHVSTSITLPVKEGGSIGAEQIPSFIRSNRAELALIPSFFCESNPIKHAGLKISLHQQDKIRVDPVYTYEKGILGKEIQYFEDFIYCPHLGFYELPLEFRLPEQYRESFRVKSNDLVHFIHHELPLLLPKAAEIDLRLIKPNGIQLVAKEIQVDRNGGTYAASLAYETERGSIPVLKVWDAIVKKSPFLFDPVGRFDLSEDRYDWLKKLGPEKVDQERGLIFLTTLELIRLNAFEPIDAKSGAVEVMDELLQFKYPEEPDVSALKSSLRPYQEIGVKWLWFLYHQGLSGLLCDEMGLGKTHQAMGTIAAVQQLKKGTRPKFLVICPTSVLYHWEEKLKEYLPELKVLAYHGQKRSLERFETEFDLLLTSYGIWRNEVLFLSKIVFEMAILDELQIAKNDLSRLYATMLQIQSKVKIGLTGTPIENRLRELKSLFDLILPTYMPGQSDYNRLFIKPIERNQNIKQRNVLSRLIRPFILRRKKDDVLVDLPEKTEEIFHCDLHPSQKKLYVEVLKRWREQHLTEIEDPSKVMPYIHIFAILSSLKQICDHPAVFLKKASDYKKYHSGKWELFLELLHEAQESEQKVVVFSHYLGMLDIIESYLEEHHIGFAGIRGSTINRGEEIHRFQTDPNCRVFVASLQAGGLGIDLTAASVVIHYDRWWNAARENQATDRVHRIGQTRGVQVFKLVTLDTFEERIDQLITRKGKLMEEVIGVDDHQIIKSFTRDELLQLLHYVEKL